MSVTEALTPEQTADRLTEIVKYLKDELNIVAAEAAQAMSPHNALKVNRYVGNVMSRLHGMLSELLPPGCAAPGDGCENL